MEVARRGGNIAKITRDNLEKELGRTVITNQNKLNYKYLDETKKQKLKIINSKNNLNKCIFNNKGNNIYTKE